MQAHLRGVRFIKLTFLLMIAAITIAGCGGRLFTYKGDKVTQQNLIIVLKDGNQQGVWKTNELAIKYQYQMTPETLKFTGTVELVGGFAIGFNYVNHLAVYLLFLDNQGVVLENALIYAGENNLSIPIPMGFERTIPIPEGAQSISFAYDGELMDLKNHDTTTYNIWLSPSGQ
ncbi:MAG: hypothetical protein HY881_10290 [Deltaproteobacteria bacterium]|nr:hypothetical protein [Deltaproteobacteria bacterium]